MADTRIVVAESGGRYRSDRKWFVVVVNNLTGRPVQSLSGVWRTDPEGHRYHTYEWIYGLHRKPMYKKDAIAQAKIEAARSGQKFSLKTDLVDYESLRAGPVRNCLICNTNPRYSWEAFVCEVCLNQVAAGKALSGKRLSQLIETRDLLSLVNDFYSERSTRLADLLLAIAGTRLGEEVNVYDSRKREGAIIVVKDKSDRNGSNLFESTDDQAAAMRDLVAHVNDLLSIAYQKGRDDGEQLMLRLAAGELTIDEYQDRSVRSKTGDQPVRAHFKIEESDDPEGQGDNDAD